MQSKADIELLEELRSGLPNLSPERSLPAAKVYKLLATMAGNDEAVAVRLGGFLALGSAPVWASPTAVHSRLPCRPECWRT